MEMQVEIRIKKYGISNQPDVCIFDDPCLFHVWTIRRGMSDTPETMGGLSGSTNCTPS